MHRSAKFLMLSVLSISAAQLLGCISGFLADLFFEVGPFLL